MNILLVGYGRMGREVESALLERGHRLCGRVDRNGSGDYKLLTDSLLAGADGIIEFALSDNELRKRIEAYRNSGKPAVVGTTGWNEMETEVKTLYEKEAPDGAALLKGSNFSLGAHLFFRLSKMAASLLNAASEYDVALLEQHHAQKIDYPSGTAITAASGIIESLDRKTHVVTNPPDGAVAPDALQVSSIRVGSVPGVHEMIMDSPWDNLSLRHEARGRGAFALGAVRGLEWLHGRQGWFDAENFIDDFFQGVNK